MTLVVADGATLDSLNESELKRAANVEKDAMKPPLSATKQEPAGSYLPNDVPGRFSQSHGPSYPRKRPRRTNVKIRYCVMIFLLYFFVFSKQNVDQRVKAY